MLELFFLVLRIGVSSDSPMVVMPEKYTMEQCQKAGKSFEPRNNAGYICVPAPPRS